MNQIPNFLIKMQGLNFGLKNLFVLLGLCLLEFFNLFTMISFILSMFFVLFSDFVFGAMRFCCIQLGVKSIKIFKILFLNAIIYGFFFIMNDLFIVPYSNVFLKKIGLELYKNKIFSSIQPRHVIHVPEIKLNVSVAKRQKNALIGCLIHLEEKKIFGIVEKLIFEKDPLLTLHLLNAKGKLITDYDTIHVTFEDAIIEADTDVIIIPDKVMFFDLETIESFMSRSKIFLISILSAFLIFIIVFSNSYFMKGVLTLFFLILFGNSVNVMDIGWLVFLILSSIIILYFIRIIKCLDF